MENLGDMPIGKKVRLDIAMQNKENISSSSSSSTLLLSLSLSLPPTTIKDSCIYQGVNQWFL